MQKEFDPWNKMKKEVHIRIPLTTSSKRDRFYVDAGVVNGKPAAAIISQIRLVDTRRLVEKIGMLNRVHFEAIRKSVKDLL